MRTWVAEALATSKEYLILYAPRGDATIKQSSFSISSSSTSRRCVHTHVHTRMLVHMPMHIRAYRDCICSRARAHTHTHTHTHDAVSFSSKGVKSCWKNCAWISRLTARTLLLCAL